MAKDEVAEQSIRVFTAFFAALVGFGLKHLLDKPFPDGGWLPFIGAILVFLRFMTGSAVHMWREHVKDVEDSKRKQSRELMRVDLFCLAAFGAIATLSCQADSPEQFWGLLALLISLALLWDSWTLVAGNTSDETRRLANFWWNLDVSHFAVLVAVIFLHQWSPQLAWWLFAISGAIVLWVDFGRQITVS